MIEEDFIKVPTKVGVPVCDGCTFNEEDSIRCWRPDHFSDCWDDNTNYIFKEKSSERT